MRIFKEILKIQRNERKLASLDNVIYFETSINRKVNISLKWKIHGIKSSETDLNVYETLVYDRGNISNWVRREGRNSKYDVGQLADH